MPALIDLRRRIRSVQNTRQITKAMKTVSTAKFRKSQRRVLESRPWWHTWPALLLRAAAWAGPGMHPLLARREEMRVTGLVITSDKGLAGAFNSNLLARAQEYFEERARESEVRLALIGKKAVTYFRRAAFPVDLAVSERTDKITPAELEGIARELMRLFILQRTDAVVVVYNEFKSILAPRVTILPLLPVAAEDRGAEPGATEPDWEPGLREALVRLLPLGLTLQVLHCFFESQAAEHAARMMAMDNATRNAEELIGRLVLELNKIRQASITKELLEIMTAVEAQAG
ncbi:MAG: ATP synthase F1 subunit gamma [Candidatus Aminicenantes bacterium RBG_13_62_12]|nr:MAG: ATP synthase F1 subunit gamma [Candidatus Aminicenantes bacterium RBG_13_62_12]